MNINSFANYKKSKFSLFQTSSEIRYSLSSKFTCFLVIFEYQLFGVVQLTKNLGSINKCS